ncbi:unnamed protein product [Gongylonema pulchrum]|uniref:Uncharacterized protein n=1 Tax=Gongylonema pulchrum TaxID=637853 RepID=A0A183DCY8_9BILA|nr:unnamed protein product [Gongylonema pulchrum]VDK55214.1 unnamed protein product [Gongylonema pulchrum]
MVLDRRRVLETSLFDSEQIVTVQYLSRHADIPLTCQSDGSGNDEDYPSLPSRQFRTQLVRDCDLENARRAYRETETCEIYCLHTKPIKVNFAMFC